MVVAWGSRPLSLSTDTCRWVSPERAIHRIGIGACRLVQAVRRTTPHAPVRAILDLITLCPLREELSLAVNYGLDGRQYRGSVATQFSSTSTRSQRCDACHVAENTAVRLFVQPESKGSAIRHNDCDSQAVTRPPIKPTHEISWHSICSEKTDKHEDVLGGVERPESSLGTEGSNERQAC